MNWVQVFKSGRHTDSSGYVKEWSDVDLDLIVNKYNNQIEENKHDAPVVIGHPKTDAPAYAWVEALKKEGNILYAKFKDVNNDFKNMVKDKLFNKISIALYPDMLLRHVGFLGATPPAVKGLKAPEFNEIEFSNIDIEAKELIDEIEKLPTENKEEQEIIKEEEIDLEFKEKANPDSAKNTFKTNYGETMDEFIKAVADALRKAFNEEVASKALEVMKGMPMPANTKKEFNEKEALISELQTKLQLTEKALHDKENQFQQQLDKQNTEIQNMKFNEYFDSKVRSGKVAPAQRELVRGLYFMALKDETTTIEFGENKQQLKGSAILERLLDTFENKVELKEVATGSFNEYDLAEQDKYILSYKGGQ